MSYFHPDGTPPALPAGKRAAARQQLEQIVSRSARRRRWLRWRRPGLIGAASAVIVLGSTAAVMFAQDQPVTNKSGARCYTVASTTGPGHYTTAVAAGPAGRVSLEHAWQVCRALWRQGFLSTGASGITSPPAGPGNYPVPALVVCTMPDGTAAVFPGGPGTCAKLGLPRALSP
ncbi:MAG TPA: hypothetical protein VH637_13275 [Streptosporangiaceae bacterium]|jgi:hypothetical protein